MTIKNFVCKKCKQKCSSSHVAIASIGNRTVDLRIHCPHCSTLNNVKAELNLVDKMGRFRSGQFGGVVESKEGTIKDQDILGLRNDLNEGKHLDELL